MTVFFFFLEVGVDNCPELSNPSVFVILGLVHDEVSAGFIVQYILDSIVKHHL